MTLTKYGIDVIGKELALYSIEWCFLKTVERFEDDSHILYVNGTYRSDTPSGKFMMEDMRNPTLKEGGINYFFPGIPILSVQSKISPIFIKTTILEQKKILRFACTKNFIRIHLLMIRTHL